MRTITNAAIGFTCAVLASGAFFFGVHIGGKEPRRQLAQYQMEAKMQKARADSALAKLEKQKVERDATEKRLRADVARITARPGYRVVCLDADGMRIANDAIAGHTGRTP